ncbi:MAG: hypothetical protein ABIA77_03560, partial [Candidatus Omnitrophota bacterium]
MNLKNIIDKIKEEGVNEAERAAGEIVARAEEKAREIIESAEREKEKTVERAREDAEKLKNNSEEALKQASRDVVLSLKEQIKRVFDHIVKKEVSAVFTPELLKEVILRLVEAFKKNDTAEVEVMVSEKDKQALESFFSAKLK